MQTWGEWRTKRAELIVEFWHRLMEIEIFAEENNPVAAIINELLYGGPSTGKIIHRRIIDFGKDNNPTDSLHCQIEKQLSEIRREHSEDGLSIGITEHLI